MSKNMMETEGPQMTSQDGAYALHAGYTRLHARTRTGFHRQICNTYCFPTAAVIRERVSVLRYTYIVCIVWY
jgi:hypothetical protein